MESRTIFGPNSLILQRRIHPFFVEKTIVGSCRISQRLGTFPCGLFEPHSIAFRLSCVICIGCFGVLSALHPKPMQVLIEARSEYLACRPKPFPAKFSVPLVNSTCRVFLEPAWDFHGDLLTFTGILVVHSRYSKLFTRI